MKNPYAIPRAGAIAQFEPQDDRYQVEAGEIKGYRDTAPQIRVKSSADGGRFQGVNAVKSATLPTGDKKTTNGNGENKTRQYIIYGGIALVVIVGGIFAYRKFIKK